MVYPGRVVRDVLPQFRDSNVIKPTRQQRAELLDLETGYTQDGLSLLNWGN